MTDTPNGIYGDRPGKKCPFMGGAPCDPPKCSQYISFERDGLQRCGCAITSAARSLILMSECGIEVYER